MLEGVYGCFMTCNVFLAGNSEVSLELQCFTAKLITYIVCECYALEWFLGNFWRTAVAAADPFVQDKPAQGLHRIGNTQL